MLPAVSGADTLGGSEHGAARGRSPVPIKRGATNMDANVMQTITNTVTQVGLRVLGALVLWVVGRMLISMAVRLVTRGLSIRHIDATITRYLANILNVVLNIALVVAILGYFGVETTTFAAIVADAGVAIGVAWDGLLGGFAAGAFIISLLPVN